MFYYSPSHQFKQALQNNFQKNDPETYQLIVRNLAATLFIPDDFLNAMAGLNMMEYQPFCEAIKPHFRKFITTPEDFKRVILSLPYPQAKLICSVMREHLIYYVTSKTDYLDLKSIFLDRIVDELDSTWLLRECIIALESMFAKTQVDKLLTALVQDAGDNIKVHFDALLKNANQIHFFSLTNAQTRRNQLFAAVCRLDKFWFDRLKNAIQVESKIPGLRSYIQCDTEEGMYYQLEC